MKFIINRASDCGRENKKPHKNAIYNPETTYWEIEIKTVEEIVELDEEGVIILPDYLNGIPLITIYDGYVE